MHFEIYFLLCFVTGAVCALPLLALSGRPQKLPDPIPGQHWRVKCLGPVVITKTTPRFEVVEYETRDGRTHWTNYAAFKANAVPLEPATLKDFAP